MSRLINVGGTIFMSCFVCDQAIVGEKKPVGKTVTSYTKQNIAEKMCNLMGEGHVVVVANNDVICGKCCDLINKIDKIEVDLDNARLEVLNIIEKTYHLNGNAEEQSSSDSDKNQITKNMDPNKTDKIDNTHIKIYKCGFCSYQSKELNEVRVHMKIHADADSAKQNPPPPRQDFTKQRIFLCQVCSASFDSKEECIQHIGKNHPKTGAETMLGKSDPSADKSLREHL